MIKRFIPIISLLLLSACATNNNSGGGTQPVPPQTFTSYFGSLNGQCSDFDFPQDLDGVHYCVRSGVQLPLGQTINLTFTISGSGQFVVLDPRDVLPATVHLFIWRTGDNLSCIGTFQQFRFWTARTVINGPGTYTVSARIDPSQWTDCYGQPGSNNPALFNAALASGVVGYTFGGASFSGHGLAGRGPVHFHLDSFTVGNYSLRKRKRK